MTYKFGQEGNHEIEKTNGLHESETQNSVREELATESRVAGNTVDKGGEHETDTNTGSSQTNRSRTHTDIPGDLDECVGHLGAVRSATGNLVVGHKIAGDHGGPAMLEVLRSCGGGETLMYYKCQFGTVGNFLGSVALVMAG